MRTQTDAAPARIQGAASILAGVFFYMATLTAIFGLLLYRPLFEHFNSPGTASLHRSQVMAGVFLELLLCCANAGTALMLFPWLKGYSERAGLAYIVFRLLEVAFILAGILSVLALLGFNASLVPGAVNVPGTGQVLRNVREWTDVLGPHFMLGINTMIYSTVFLRSRLVPRSLALLGITGSLLIFTAALMEIWGIITPFSAPLLLMAFPVAIFEMILATWLVRRGLSRVHH